MPKFVWIAEVGTRESFAAAGKATGMLLMDATEPEKDRNTGLLFGKYVYW